MNFPARNEKILRNFEIFLPKFHFILPNFYFGPPWRILFSSAGNSYFPRSFCFPRSFFGARESSAPRDTIDSSDTRYDS